jgi:hypothetical protein
MEDEEAPTVHGEGARYWLDYRGHRFELRPGELVIGRSAGCHLVLDDALVSRRHARVVVTAQDVVLEDLGSANGVFVNGERVSGTKSLTVGDRLVVGQQELIVRVGQATRETFERQRFTAVTLTGMENFPATDPPARVIEDNDSTHQGDALTLLGGVADKVLALGRGEEAEKILGNFLNSLLERARAGSKLEALGADRAAEYAVKIATVTGKPRWVDYAVELFRHLERPLPTSVVDQLYTVLRSVSGIDRSGLREYIAVLKQRSEKLSPTERFLIQRIEGLERLAALR